MHTARRADGAAIGAEESGERALLRQHAGADRHAGGIEPLHLIGADAQLAEPALVVEERRLELAAARERCIEMSAVEKPCETLARPGKRAAAPLPVLGEEARPAERLEQPVEDVIRRPAHDAVA